jgi:hypothetical protein
MFAGMMQNDRWRQPMQPFNDLRQHRLSRKRLPWQKGNLAMRRTVSGKLDGDAVVCNLFHAEPR